MLSRFHLVPECDGWTGRRTDKICYINDTPGFERPTKVLINAKKVIFAARCYA